VSARCIVVGVDGSAGAEAALAWCARMAPVLDAEVVAVHAMAPLVYTVPVSVAIGDVPALYDDGVRDELQGELEQWCAPLRDAGVPHRVQLLDGSPADVLLRTADALDADMVVVGRRGHGGFSELLLGSVPHQLSHHCARPLVIVPA
jgi:nucleotide-binding universal stress UspA family protein